MFDLSAIDVALGLIFVYLILSLTCTALNETISSIFSWRAKMLREGLANLLAGDPQQQTDLTGHDLVEKLYAHPLVSALIRRRPPRMVSRVFGKAEARARYPSYVPSRTFVTAILDLDLKKPARAAPATAEEARQALDAAIADIPSTPVKRSLMANQAYSARCRPLKTALRGLPVRISPGQTVVTTTPSFISSARRPSERPTSRWISSLGRGRPTSSNNPACSSLTAPGMWPWRGSQG